MAYTIFAAPWVALGYELTPDYHERTRLMGVQNFLGQIAYVVSPWFLWIMTYKPWFKDQVEGASALAIGIGVLAAVLGVLPAIFLRERFQHVAETEEEGRPGRGGLRQEHGGVPEGMKSTLSSRPFLKLCAATFLVFNGFMLISSFQFYVIIYYVFRGDQARGAEYAGLRRHPRRHLHVRGDLLHHLAGHEDRQAARLLRLHRDLHARVRHEVVRLRPATPCSSCSPRRSWPSGWGGSSR